MLSFWSDGKSERMQDGLLSRKPESNLSCSLYDLLALRSSVQPAGLPAKQQAVFPARCQACWLSRGNPVLSTAKGRCLTVKRVARGCCRGVADTHAAGCGPGARCGI